jgi:hypothetical protein
VTDSGAYAAQWRDLHRRVVLFWALWLLYLPVVVGSLKLLNFIEPGLGSRLAQYVAIGWGLLWMAAGYYRFSFRCPRCGGWYFSSDSQNSTFSKYCLHCGLPRGGGPND